MTFRKLASGEVVSEAELVEASRVRPAPPMPKARPLQPRPRPAFEPVMRQATRAAPRSDLALLMALDGAKDRLYSGERQAFAGMLSKLQSGWIQALSYSQRAWAQEVAARVGIDASAPEGWREVAAEIRGDARARPRSTR